MRVLMLVNSYPSVHSPSGAPYVTARVEAMRRAGVDVEVVALVPSHSRAVRALRRRAGAIDDDGLALHPESGLEAVEVRWGTPDVLSVRAGRRPETAVRRAVDAVNTAIRGRSHDVIHAHGMYWMPAGEVARRVAARASLPAVVTLHGGDVTEVMTRTPRRHAATLTAADATLYVSTHLRDLAVSLGAPMQDSHVVPNGVDLATFTPAGAGERSAGPPRLLFVGNLLEVKGADRLPAILAAVRARHPGATLDVLGSGALAGGLESVEGIRLHGRVSQGEVAGAMQGASVLVVPSRSEGWGCVASEAYATGLPVVASAVGGLVESVAPIGHVDVTTEDGLTDRFAEAVDRVLTDRAPLPSVLGWDDVVARELAVLEDVVAKRSATPR